MKVLSELSGTVFVHHPGERAAKAAFSFASRVTRANINPISIDPADGPGREASLGDPGSDPDPGPLFGHA